MDMETVGRIYHELESQGIETLRKEGVKTDDMVIGRSLDMRYVGQAYELNIPLQWSEDREDVPAQLIRAFNTSYESYYGHCTPSEPTEIVNFRVTAIGRVRKPPVKELPSGGGKPSPRDRADVFFEETGWVDCPFYDREDLIPGFAFPGPAVIEEYTSTTVVPPGFNTTVDPFANIVIKANERAR